jgi:hypothetical protein
MFRHVLLFIAAGALLGSGCGRATLKTQAAISPQTVPAAVVVDRNLPTTMLDQELSDPVGLARDSAGHVYLCDAGNNRVIEFTDDLLPMRDCCGYGNDLGMLKNPRYVVADGDLGIVVSDADNRRIQRFTPHLDATDQFKLSDMDDPLKYGIPSGLALTADGSYRIADHDRNRLIAMTNVGDFDKFVGDLGERGGQLEKPEKVLVDKEDNVYVCDAGNSRVVIYDRYGNLVRMLSHDLLADPASAVLDRTGNVWVLDRQSTRIFCFTPKGILLTSQPLEILGTEGPLDGPSDLLFLPNGRLLVSDSGNNRLILCKIVYNTPTGS